MSEKLESIDKEALFWVAFVVLVYVLFVSVCYLGGLYVK